MKFLFCVEDDSDEMVFEILLGKLLGTTVEAQPMNYRRRGWTTVLDNAYRVARVAHRQGLDGALFAVDNDGTTPVHSPSHESGRVATCRVCQLLNTARVEEPLSWSNRMGSPPLRYLFAVPVQALETWLLHAQGHPFTGAAEELGHDLTGRRELKRLLYGTELPDRETMIRIARPIAERVNPLDLARKSESFAFLLKQAKR